MPSLQAPPPLRSSPPSSTRFLQSSLPLPVVRPLLVHSPPLLPPLFLTRGPTCSSRPIPRGNLSRRQRQPPHRNICFLHLAHHERVRGVRDRRRQCRHRDDFARGKALRQRRLNGNGNVSCGLRQRHGRYVQNLHLHAHRHLHRFCD